MAFMKNLTSVCLFSVSIHIYLSTTGRYLVSHEAGVHTVTVPLVEKLLHYSELPDGMSLCLMSSLLFIHDHKNIPFHFMWI